MNQTNARCKAHLTSDDMTTEEQDRLGAAGPFETVIVDAVVEHMNLDHGDDCRAIYTHHTGSPLPVGVDVFLVDYDRDGARLQVADDDASMIVVPWSGPVGTRADVRYEFIAMVEATRTP